VKKRIISGARKALRKIRRVFRGFTIIELIVVIAIVGVLVSTILASVTSYIGKSKDSRMKAELSEIAKGAAIYYADNGMYSGYEDVIADLFKPVAEGSDYHFSPDENGDIYVVYAKLATSSNYWCIDSTGAKIQLENPPDSGIYACVSGSGGGGEEGFVCGDTLVDARDGKEYPTVYIAAAGQCWMAGNLNVGTRVDASTYPQGANCASAANIEKYCYNDSDAKCTAYGGLYEWDQAMCGSTTEGAQGICPTGWHLPTDAEWYALEYAYWDGVMGACGADRTGEGCSPAGSALKEAGTTHWNSGNTGTNTSGFTALGAGTCMFGMCDYMGYSGAFWSSLQYDSSASLWPASLAIGPEIWTRALHYDSGAVVRGRETSDSSVSVRCIKN